MDEPALQNQPNADAQNCIWAGMHYSGHSRGDWRLPRHAGIANGKDIDPVNWQLRP